ncbi:gamma-glutamyl-gamma-aminobutyrate hydrolase [Philodulcilactobacillus myokoensis]|uniref:Gamma-glutamyl-gamma-aminobutyrate hydrolase n=1 Tax=Philodulcilactobacillus myokoensis TaxID=2929573 RepID=A0A9W6B0R0_9LACO|nr:gamma-glutamyl-gamma-aminobutyrate hydrolase [Philodulcilactobacillus myokoensis]
MAVKHNALPISFPILPPRMADDAIQMVDGLILTGGVDIDPKFYHQKRIPEVRRTYPARDASELALFKAAVKQNKPVLGVCRGMQTINIGLGGNLYQDLDVAFKKQNAHPILEHKQKEDGSIPTQHITLDPNSQVAKSCGVHPFVNSRHHQAVRKVGQSLKVVGRADDHIIEAIENSDASIQGVQWHPENMFEHYSEQDQLFADFFKRAAQN